MNPRSNLKRDYHGNLEIYVDGCCLSNGRHGATAGYGVWFNYNHPLNNSGPVKNALATNNNAEIQAATHALRQARKIGELRVKLYTDSEFLINCMTKWISTWRQNNWKLANGEPVQNKHSLLELQNEMNSMQKVLLEHVPGHSGVAGNVEADALAKKGARCG